MAAGERLKSQKIVSVCLPLYNDFCSTHKIDNNLAMEYSDIDFALKGIGARRRSEVDIEYTKLGASAEDLLRMVRMERAFS